MKLKAPKGCGGVGFEGQEYPAVKGVIDVPDHAVVLLEPGYGCTLIAEPEAPKQQTENSKQKTGL